MQRETMSKLLPTSWAFIRIDDGLDMKPDQKRKIGKLESLQCQMKNLGQSDLQKKIVTKTNNYVG